MALISRLVRSFARYEGPVDLIQVDYNYRDPCMGWPGACRTGKNQSPIDISDWKTIPSDSLKHFSLKLYYKPQDVYIQFNPVTYISRNSLGSLAIMNHEKGVTKVYDMIQFHFHAPAEHSFNGYLPDAELHLVHANPSDKKDLAVLGFCFKEGAHSDFMAKVIKGNCNLDLLDLNKGDRVVNDYYYYFGSLTTPRCYEIVRWLVYPEILTASKEQIDFFRKKWAQNPRFANGNGNNRPVQPLNDRYLYRFSGS